VYRVDSSGGILEEYCSLSDAAAKVGVDGPKISNYLAGRAQDVSGHYFRYKLDGDMYKRTAKVRGGGV
jgi:hypothetical protein